MLAIFTTAKIVKLTPLESKILNLSSNSEQFKTCIFKFRVLSPLEFNSVSLSTDVQHTKTELQSQLCIGNEGHLQNFYPVNIKRRQHHRKFFYCVI